MRRPFRTKAVATLCVLCASSAALTQPAPPDMSAAQTQADYHPSMGDLMTMAIQPRHIKLQLAGVQRNWSYAEYELGELRNAFARIARTIPRYRTVDTVSMTAAVIRAPLDAVDQAIKARSATQFAIAYARLTQACNGCHQSLSHAEVVIKQPAAAIFPDQDFRPANSRKLP
jgi:hypothetical protein